MKKDLHTIARFVHDKGLGVLMIKACRKLLRYIFYTNSAFWCERDLRLPVRVPDPGMPVTMVFDAPEECIAWMQGLSDTYVYNERELSVVDCRRHWFPFLRADEGAIVGCIKVGLDKVYIVDHAKVLSLAPHKAFIYDTYILPSCRKRHLAGFLIGSTLKRLQQEGFTLVGCHIPHWNAASLKAYARAGFCKIEYVRHLRLFGVVKYEFHFPVRERIVDEETS